MCRSRTLNNRINKLYERCLRLIYNDKKSTFRKLLDKVESVSIHNRNLKFLATEIYKVTKDYPLKFLQTLSRLETRLIEICTILLVLRCF